MKSRQNWLSLGAGAAAIAGLALIVMKNATVEVAHQLVNVSYDPTRELYQTLNPLFIASYEKDTGRHLVIIQSHGGSSRQARKIASGEQPADVVTLGLYSDIDGLRKRGLISQNWADRLPNHSSPYTSTIVFVVREGNPHDVKDWPDLLKPGVEVVTPDPRTSSNGKLTALAAWAATVRRGGSESEARAYLQSLYQHVSTLEEGARGAALSFANQELGDVHVTWENEALREAAESKGKLAIVYPPVSILAESYVAWVDAAVARKENLVDASAYLTFLFSDSAQETIARLGYRPYKRDASGRAGVSFPSITLVPINEIARDWDDLNQKFFGENGIIESVIELRRK